MLPYAVRMFNEIYLFSAVILGSIFLYYSIRLLRDETNSYAMPAFAFSLVYLALLFIAMLIDHFLYL
jgi:protoheme IX farnesyltransferase